MGLSNLLAQIMAVMNKTTIPPCPLYPTFTIMHQARMNAITYKLNQYFQIQRKGFITSLLAAQPTKVFTSGMALRVLFSVDQTAS